MISIKVGKQILQQIQQRGFQEWVGQMGVCSTHYRIEMVCHAINQQLPQDDLQTLQNDLEARFRGSYLVVQILPLLFIIKYMKFTLIDRTNTSDKFEEISSDQDDGIILKPQTNEQRSRFETLFIDFKPLTINPPPIHIMVEQTRVRKPSNHVIITLEESEEEDLYVIQDRPPAINKYSQECQVIKSTQKIQTCTICLLDIKLPGAKIHCGHSFCGECIIQSSNVSNKCPNCRARYKQIVIGSRVIKVKNKTLEEQMPDFDDEPCYGCGRNDRPQELLVCDHCEFAFCHVSCDSRLQGHFPDEEWYCHDCTLNQRHIT